MTKMFCDRCGKEILSARRIKIEDVIPVHNPDGDFSYCHIYEVCPMCAKIVQQYIELDYEKEETP